MASGNRDVHRRRSIRLPGHDYAQPGAYFVTACAYGRACLFGDIVGTDMRLNEWGEIVCRAWKDLPRHYPHVALDLFVVMPNHVHGIIWLTDNDTAGAGTVGAGFKPAPTKRHALPEIVRAFKTFSARRINDLRGTPGAAVWQRNYYEHVIRSEESLRQIRQYIADNPARWADDRENPAQGRPGRPPDP